MSKRRPQPSSPAPNPPTGRNAPGLSALPPAIDTRTPEPVDPAHLAAIEAGLAEAKRGAYVADADVEAIYRRAGL